MRPDNPPDDPRTLRQYLIASYREALADEEAAEAAGAEPIMSIHYRQRIAALESGEPVTLTVHEMPERFRLHGADRWTPHVLEADGTLRLAVVTEPEEAA